MIVLGGSNSHGNVLHVAIGPETDAWLGLHGAALANITQILNNMDRNQPVFLHLTQCNSEHEVTDFLTSAIQAGMTYPFPVPVNIFVPPAAKADKPAAKSAADAKETAAPVVSSNNRCSRCGNTRKELVPKVAPSICYDCLTLDLMLAANRKRKSSKPPVTGDSNAKPDITV